MENQVWIRQEEKKKPKYNALQNSLWMISLAWKRDKSVLGFVLAIPAIAVALNLVQLFIAPAVLGKVETAAPLEELLGTLALFTAVLFLLLGLQVFVSFRKEIPYLEVRMEVVRLTRRKSATTSYPNYLDTKFTEAQSLSEQATYSNWAAAEHIWITLSTILENLAGFAIYLVLLSNLEPLLLLTVVITAAISYFMNHYTSGWVTRHKEEQKKYQNSLTYVERVAKNRKMAKDVRIFGLADWLTELYDKSLALGESFQKRKNWALFGGNLVDVVLTFARNGIAYFYLIRMALAGGLSAAEFLLYFSAFSGFTAWVTGILGQFNTLHTESQDLSNAREFLEWPEPFRFEGGVPIPEAEAYELKLEEVSYRYPEAGKDTIHDLTLTIRPGEKVAIVGLNGAGKTTLVKLISGLLDPTEGRVLLNGTDIRDFDRREYYRLFSAVFQDFSILELTVAGNVAQNDQNIDLDRVKDCIEKAGLTEKVESLPQGLDTHVGRDVYKDGILLSGGETQRLMLARALYKDGPILMLDEPTAALDPIAENDIYMKYSSMTQGRTSLFISHRLASTRFCDRILFLGNGTVLEEGTHDQLLARGGEYARLFEVQSRYYQEGKDF